MAGRIEHGAAARGMEIATSTADTERREPVPVTGPRVVPLENHYPLVRPNTASLLGDLFDFGNSSDAKEAVDFLGPPNRSVPSMAPVRKAASSVVRILGDHGWTRKTGSGWVAEPNIVVTNTHVVSGTSRVYVQRRGKGAELPAKVVYYDPVADIALLKVPRLDAPSLRRDPAPERGESGALLGFPQNGPYRSRSIRWGGATEVIHNGNVRRADEMRGKFEPGNSGGPVVGVDGRVISTTFAKKTSQGIHGGYGVPNDVVEAALRAPRRTVQPRDMPERSG